jgi:hypothetical protein
MLFLRPEVEMKTKLTMQQPSTLWTRFALICGFVLAVTCSGPAGAAQQHKIYAFGVDGVASGPLFDLLSHDFSLVNLDNFTPLSELYPVLIGPGALANQDVTQYLVRAYGAGLTVGIVYATEEQANLFDELVEGEQEASCIPARGSSTIALYAVHRTLREQPQEESRYCLPSFMPAGPETEEQWLSAAFAREAAPPAAQPVDDANASSVNLDDLSRKVHCSDFYADANGQVQDDHFVTSARSFDSQRDYYYVQDFPKVISYRTAPAFLTTASPPIVKPPNGRDTPLTGTRILFSQPSTTTQYVSEYTNSRTTSVSGTVGFQGISPNISATVSVTVGTSTTVTVPPVTIQNTSNLTTASSAWRFIPAGSLRNLLYDTAENWVWTIDRNVYGPTPNEIPEVFFYSEAGTTDIRVQGRCAFPPPFRTFDVTASMITSAEPATVQRGGGTFLIRGVRMYPGIVTNVLLGGDALPTSNYVRISDTEIRVVVPSSQRTGMNPIQVNTSFNGTVLPSNTNVNVNVQ